MNHDHRQLNVDLDVFASDPLAGSGLPLWLPAGAAIRSEVQRLARDEPADSDGWLLMEGTALRLQADVRWLEACEQRWTARRQR